MHVLYGKIHGGLLSLTVSGVCCLWDVCHQPISDDKEKNKGLLAAANVPQLDEEEKKGELLPDFLQVDLTSAGTLSLLDC